MCVHPQLCPGLSPRVRGNLVVVVAPAPVVGSIPACAGEPPVGGGRGGGQRVYPRVCGGTLDRVIAAQQAWGLSPRVRGNLI